MKDQAMRVIEALASQINIINRCRQNNHNVMAIVKYRKETDDFLERYLDGSGLCFGVNYEKCSRNHISLNVVSSLYDEIDVTIEPNFSGSINVAMNTSDLNLVRQIKRLLKAEV